ncbi:MAG: M20/M25/M40 family metallo-hydrolase [Acidobacteriota bacterium]
MKLAAGLLVVALALLASPLPAQEHVDLGMVTRIREEGFRDSNVMQLASELMDGVGPRLTGSSNLKLAEEWARQKFAAWGLANVHLESWGPFGRGWEYEKSSVRMIAPDHAELLALPEAWTPGTAGPLRGPAISVRASSKEDLEKYRGKVAGRIVFFGDVPETKPHEKVESQRFDEKALSELFEYEIPGGPPRYDREAFRKRRELRQMAGKFFADEKALAIVTPSRRDGAVLAVQSAGGWKKDEEPARLPGLVMSLDHFGRVARLLQRNVPVDLELDVAARFLDTDPMQANVVAEIPGTDKRGEVVMLGAHFDSWHAGTGATDNGAGSVVMMEVMRILKALATPPRRTIRIALWSGEEQGLLGSKAYVAQHFATRPEPADPEQKKLPDWLRKPTFPITTKPEHAKLAAYFNVDNGSGKIRGIYTEENAAVVPVFESWMAPLKDLGVTTVTMRDTGGTDHQSFDAVGLPGFQFIQDELEYETRTHHTNLDTYERLQRQDLMQAAVVVACFAWEAAMRPEMLPRKPLPTERPAARSVPERPVSGGAAGGAR